MKCHYEVLEVPRDASSDDLKKSYRRLAIKWHPDKNLGNPAEATEQFQLIQQAFEVLNDPHERAWYDDHREAILQGKSGDQCDAETLDLFPYYSPSCFQGFGDDEKGFYSVYREVFNKIAAEDSAYQSEEESDFEIPNFGKSNSSHEEVKLFYDYWQSYCTKKSYSWLDSFDTRQAPNRRVSRAMEKENKKARDSAKKARNNEVQELVKFVRKRDKRVQAYAQYLQEVSAEKAKKSEKKRLEKIKERNSELAAHKESDWAKFSNLEDELKNIEANLASEFGDSLSPDNSDFEEEVTDQNLYCVACNKLFKNPNAFENHETSKKHKDNVQILKNQMKDSDDDMESDKDEDDYGEEDDTGVSGEEESGVDDNNEISSASNNSDSPNEDVATSVNETTENNVVDSDYEFSFCEAEGREKDPLFCKSCGKWFKTTKAVNNHKTSQAHIKNSKLYNKILKDLGSDTEDDDADEFRTSSCTGSASENDSILEEIINCEGDIKEDFERVLSKFEHLEKTESKSLQNDVEKIYAEFDAIMKDNDELEKSTKNKKSNKKKSKSKTNTLSELLESDAEFEFTFGQSKKQKRKQNKQQILSKSKNKPNKSHLKKSVNESVHNGKSEELNEDASISQKCNSIDDEYSTVQSDSDADNKSDPVKPSKSLNKNIKKKQPQNDSVDINTSCAVCKKTFQSKNRLFLHLNESGHSTYLPEKSSKSQDSNLDSAKKRKTKKNKK